MQLNQDSNDSLGQYSKIDQKTKISKITKSYIIKASSFFILFSLVASVPTQANASFFSDLGDLVASAIGTSAMADSSSTDGVLPVEEFGTDDFPNSQNLPVLETSSINPDTKNVNSATDMNIVEGGAISSDSLSAVGIGLESVSSGQMTTYIVKEGDTLSEIAQQFDISTNTIRWANNITGNSIKVGQKLDILPVTGVKHVIKKGDTISKIADKYDAESEDIKVFNGINGDGELKVGDVLYVPNGIIKAVTPTPSKTQTSSSSTSSGGSSVSSGYFAWPVSGGRITSPYGSRRGGYHYGVDIGAPRGTTVFAAASGVVVETVSYCKEGVTSCGGRYGNYIVIKHLNGTFSRYAHLQKVSVSVGDEISKGKKIGTVGNTGRSTGPHLHFQIEKANGSTIRPKF